MVEGGHMAGDLYVEVLLMDDEPHPIYDPEFEKNLLKAALRVTEEYRDGLGQEWDPYKEVSFLFKMLTKPGWEDPAKIYGGHRFWYFLCTCTNQVLLKQWSENVLPYHPELTSFQTWRSNTLELARVAPV